MKRIDRSAFLQRLLAIEPGVARRDISYQETCVAIAQSWLYTYNGQIACAIGSSLPTEITGAINASTLIAYLKTLSDNVIEVGMDAEGVLLIASKNKRARLPIDPEIRLRYKRVERPAPDAWQVVTPQFAEAVSLCMRCTRKYKSRRDDFAKSCIHVTGAWLEASDNIKAARFELPTFVNESVLVRATTLKEIIPLGFTQGSQGKYWLHFRNPLGLRMSVRSEEAGDYPDLSQTFQVRGRRISLPTGLEAAAKRAAIFAEIGREGRMVNARMSTDGMELSAKSFGEHSETRPLPDYRGTPMEFKVSAELLIELAKIKSGSIEITPTLLRMSDGPYTYLTSLGEANEK